MSSIHIVGAGPAGLMAATSCVARGMKVHVYDHKKAAGRKFLVAGHGGFNLTHSEDLAAFLTRYDHPEIRKIVQEFDTGKTIDWLKSIGVDTYVGSSGKVFPVKGIKPIHVLENWLNALRQSGVVFHFSHRLIDFNQEYLVFDSEGEQKNVQYEHAVFAFGGKSWSKTGSDGAWTELFSEKEIGVSLLEPSNSGLEMSEAYHDLEGRPLKNIRLYTEEAERSGELVFAHYGIEGSPVYFMNRFIRQKSFPQQIFLDLKPNLSAVEIETRLAGSKKITDGLRSMKLDGVKLELLKKTTKKVFTTPLLLAEIIKKYPLTVSGFRPLDEVISTYGGVLWEELNEDLSLKKFPKIKCAGEMLNWDAPTGGYLLQACFASGYKAGS